MLPSCRIDLTSSNRLQRLANDSILLPAARCDPSSDNVAINLPSASTYVDRRPSRFSVTRHHVIVNPGTISNKCWMIKETCLLMKQFSLSEIVSTAVLLANVVVVVVVDLSRVFHVVDSAALQVAHRCTPAPCGMLAVLPTGTHPTRWQKWKFQCRHATGIDLQIQHRHKTHDDGGEQEQLNWELFHWWLHLTSSLPIAFTFKRADWFDTFFCNCQPHRCKWANVLFHFVVFYEHCQHRLLHLLWLLGISCPDLLCLGAHIRADDFANNIVSNFCDCSLSCCTQKVHPCNLRKQWLFKGHLQTLLGIAQQNKLHQLVVLCLLFWKSPSCLTICLMHEGNSLNWTNETNKHFNTTIATSDHSLPTCFPGRAFCLC